MPSSLSDLKEIGCKSAWTIHIPPLSRAIEELLPFKIDEIWLRPVRFSLRFFKSDRLLVAHLWRPHAKDCSSRRTPDAQVRANAARGRMPKAARSTHRRCQQAREVAPRRLPTVVERLSSQPILCAQKGPTHAARYAVEGARRTRRRADRYVDQSYRLTKPRQQETAHTIIGKFPKGGYPVLLHNLLGRSCCWHKAQPCNRRLSP